MAADVINFNRPFLGTQAVRKKYLLSNLDHTLRNALVAEEICMVDRTDNYKIENPYGNTPTVETSVLTGTYTPAAWNATDDALTVDTEFKVGEHIFNFEEIVTQLDVMAHRIDQQGYAVANAIDDFCLNRLCEDGTGTYSTPSGGFTTAANINTIMGNLQSKISGYEAQYNGTFLVIENTDLPGFYSAGAATGFTFADSTMKNGLRNKFNWMGTDVYVVRTGLFDNATVGDHTWTNTDHRVFGVKKVATYAAPRGIQYQELKASGKTGTEIATWCYVGFKVWATKAALIVDITVTA